MGENVEEKAIYICEIYRKECVDIFQEVRKGIKLSSILKKVHPKSRKTEWNCFTNFPDQSVWRNRKKCAKPCHRDLMFAWKHNK